MSDEDKVNAMAAMLGTIEEETKLLRVLIDAMKDANWIIIAERPSCMETFSNINDWSDRRKLIVRADAVLVSLIKRGSSLIISEREEGS